eukprot:scaffold85740_cov66-Phaeocystis_antarctica.AAC.13
MSAPSAPSPSDVAPSASRGQAVHAHRWDGSAAGKGLGGSAAGSSGGGNMSAPFFLSSSAGGERSAQVDQPARAVWRSWVDGLTDHFLACSTQLRVLLWCLPEDLVQSSGDEDVHRSLLKRLWRRAGNGRSGARHRALCGVVSGRAVCWHQS